MLLANRTAASRIAETYPDRALLRRHPPPVQHGRSGLQAAVTLLQNMVCVCKTASGCLPKVLCVLIAN